MWYLALECYSWMGGWCLGRMCVGGSERMVRGRSHSGRGVDYLPPPHPKILSGAFRIHKRLDHRRSSRRSFFLLIIPDRLLRAAIFNAWLQQGGILLPQHERKFRDSSASSASRSEGGNDQRKLLREVATRRLTLFTHRVVSGWALTRRGIHTRGGDCTR